MRDWVWKAFTRSPKYQQYAPYWIIAFLAGVMVTSDVNYVRYAGVALMAGGPAIAHLIRYAFGDLWLAYKYSYACPCGNFSMSSSDPEMLKKLSDIHSRTCATSSERG